jgi:hypothetical protein
MEISEMPHGVREQQDISFFAREGHGFLVKR